ncbi:MAG: DNA alkylation repair protein [Melioribacteraceae bacterium]|nr:DNA alkylation repair protein [Melioribacteraceae bacterium]
MSYKEYYNEVIKTFELNADPVNALPMKKYMKDQFEFYGIKTPIRREISKKFYSQNFLPAAENLKKLVEDFWKLPQREAQYFAVGLLEKFIKTSDQSAIDLYEYMIVNKSWWDIVDAIAVNLVGELLKKYPELIPGKTEEWMNSGNMWLQRTAILFQLKYKSRTDVKLLTGFIKRLMHSREFFIRKAIGWALREYSKTDPAMVIEIVDLLGLTGLSRREALRLIK